MNTQDDETVTCPFCDARVYVWFYNNFDTRCPGCKKEIPPPKKEKGK